MVRPTRPPLPATPPRSRLPRQSPAGGEDPCRLHGASGFRCHERRGRTVVGRRRQAGGTWSAGCLGKPPGRAACHRVSRQGESRRQLLGRRWRYNFQRCRRSRPIRLDGDDTRSRCHAKALPTAPQPQVDPGIGSQSRTDSHRGGSRRGGRSKSASPGYSVTILTPTTRRTTDDEVSGEVASDGRSSGHASMQIGALQTGTSSISAAPQQRETVCLRPDGSSAEHDDRCQSADECCHANSASQPIQPDIDGAVRAKAPADDGCRPRIIKPPTSQQRHAVADGALPQATVFAADAQGRQTATTPGHPGGTGFAGGANAPLAEGKCNR